MLRLAWGAPCRRIGLGTSKGSLTFAVMDKETGETSFEFIANYPPGMANLPNKMRLHQFTFMPGTGRTLGQTIVKYYCNGAVVATVARLLWVRGLPSRPAWLDGAPADPWPPAIFSRVALVLDVKVILTPPYIFQY